MRPTSERCACAPQPSTERLRTSCSISTGKPIPLVVRQSSPQELILVPRRQLAVGSYVFAASHEGMFGGRDFAYLRVVAPGEPVTPISRRAHTFAPAVAHALPPVAAALLAIAFALLLARSLLRRVAGQKALWAIGFALFAVAAVSEALAQRSGWSPACFGRTTWRAVS